MNVAYRIEEEMSGYNNIIFEGHTTAVSFADLLSGDHIVIETRNNRYEFSILDPTNGHGLLTGGKLGSNVHWAYLVGAIDEDSGDDLVKGDCLKTNARALFYLENPYGVEMLMLSKVAQIIHKRAGSDMRLVG